MVLEISESESSDSPDLAEVELKGMLAASGMRGHIIRAKVLRYLVSKKERVQ